MQKRTHEDAAKALKNSGATVTLMVEHRPDEYAAFQERLTQVQNSEHRTPSPPADGPALVKQLYVR